MSHSSCGCTTKPTVYMESTCSLVPEYDSGCHECGGKKTYDNEECVFICRDGQHGDTADVYESCIDNNTDHPVEGSYKTTPTWIRRSICEAFRPKPVIEGAGVTKTVDPKTAQITYTITQAGPGGPDTNTTYSIRNNADGSQDIVGSDGSVAILNDKSCESSATTDALGTTIVSRTCYNADGSILSGPTPYLTIQAGTVDTINGISLPDATGKITITRPDLSTECVYDCTIVDDLMCKTIPWNSASRPQLYSINVSTTPSGNDLNWTGAIVAGTPSLFNEITFTKGDAIGLGMPDCHNSIKVSLRSNHTINEIEGDGVIPNANYAMHAQGCNSFASGDGSTKAGDEQGVVEKAANKDHWITFDANDEIKFWFQINELSAASTIESGILQGRVDLHASQYMECG